ncbi:MAG: hypothetical protein L6W00_05970 [Lentisphaeria bacterium]|nr:MAG: hypothetical protein L6W00_05970 [Lentisphaeria bacterium]
MRARPPSPGAISVRGASIASPAAVTTPRQRPSLSSRPATSVPKRNSPPRETIRFRRPAATSRR